MGYVLVMTHISDNRANTQTKQHAGSHQLRLDATIVAPAAGDHPYVATPTGTTLSRLDVPGNPQRYIFRTRDDCTQNTLRKHVHLEVCVEEECALSHTVICSFMGACTARSIEYHKYCYSRAFPPTQRSADALENTRRLSGSGERCGSLGDASKAPKYTGCEGNGSFTVDTPFPLHPLPCVPQKDGALLPINWVDGRASRPKRCFTAADYVCFSTAYTPSVP